MCVTFTTFFLKPGKWQVGITRHNPSRKESLSVTVVSEVKDPKDPPMRMRTFYSSKDLLQAQASTQFKIFVELRKAEQVVKGAHVVANVTTPLGNQIPVLLKDSGAGKLRETWKHPVFYECDLTLGRSCSSRC